MENGSQQHSKMNQNRKGKPAKKSAKSRAIRQTPTKNDKIRNLKSDQKSVKHRQNPFVRTNRKRAKIGQKSEIQNRPNIDQQLKQSNKSSTTHRLLESRKSGRLVSISSILCSLQLGSQKSAHVLFDFPLLAMLRQLGFIQDRET